MIGPWEGGITTIWRQAHQWRMTQIFGDKWRTQLESSPWRLYRIRPMWWCWKRWYLLVVDRRADFPCNISHLKHHSPGEIVFLTFFFCQDHVLPIVFWVIPTFPKMLSWFCFNQNSQFRDLGDIFGNLDMELGSTIKVTRGGDSSCYQSIPNEYDLNFDLARCFVE